MSKPKTKTTALALPERVSRALGSVEREKALVELAAKYADITAITNPDGRQQVHGAYMELKNERLDIEKASKTARDEAVKFQKGCIAEEKRLITIIESEEERLRKLRDDWDAEREREKQAAIEAEQKRVADLQERVALLRGNRTLSVLSGAELIAQHIEDVQGIAVDESFEEFQETAEAARTEGLEWLTALHATAVAHEAEQERVKKAREELERLRREDAERQAADRRRLAKIRADIATLRDGYTVSAGTTPEDILEQRHIYAAIDIENGRFAELIDEAREVHAAGLRALDDAYNAAERREAQEAEARRLTAQQADLAAQRAELERQQEALRAAQESPISEPEPVIAPAESEESRALGPQISGTPWRPSAIDIVRVVASTWDVSADVARDWLVHTDFGALHQKAA